MIESLIGTNDVTTPGGIVASPGSEMAARAVVLGRDRSCLEAVELPGSGCFGDEMFGNTVCALDQDRA